MLRNIKEKLKMVHIEIPCFALLAWALANVLSIILNIHLYIYLVFLFCLLYAFKNYCSFD